tara:strand:- start:26 stop:1072 length:1047 start_codon:yes stop_codon:yes gene_type:complete
MAYTDIDKPSDYFETKLYTGTGSEQSITGLDFAPNWVWVKCRSDAENHVLHDTVRGATKVLHSDTTDGEYTVAQGLKSFNSDGFTLGTSNFMNQSSRTFASWNWKAGTSFTNDASSTGIGSIDSAGSVNTDAGFAIITYTGTGSAATVAHGLGVAPKMIINRTISAAKNWITYHASLGATKFVELDTTDAAATSSDKFNNTEPTSTVFSIESSSQNNTSGGTCLAYCFAEKQGYSKFFSYEGNSNVNGSYIHLGFSAAFIMVKPIDAADNWVMFDNKRLGFNSSTSPFNFYANKNFAETTDTGQIDILSNGFKIRNSGGTVNKSSTYIGMAFAASPFVTSSGIPATAR